MKNKINYHNERHLLLTSSFLRAYSPSAENKENLKNPDLIIHQNVKINQIKTVGNYAIRIIFDDGHNTGIYSWEYIYKLGSKFQNFLNP